MAHIQKTGLLRNASGLLVESRMGNLSRDLSASRRKLIDEGLQSLLSDLLKDLKVRGMASGFLWKGSKSCPKSVQNYGAPHRQCNDLFYWLSAKLCRHSIISS